MNEQQVFILADEALNKVVSQIEDNQWDMEMPADFQMHKRPESIKLREVINYHAYDDAWVSDILSGKTMAEVGKDKFDGDLLGDDPKANFSKIVAKAVEAARQLDDPERITHLSYGDFKAKEYLMHITLYRGFRVHDLAKVIGIDTTMPPNLVQGMWDILKPQAEMLRKMGVFKAEVMVAEDASMQDKLLAMSGRQPD